MTIRRGPRGSAQQLVRRRGRIRWRGAGTAAGRWEANVSIDYRRALAMIGATVPPHLVADAEVPVLTGPQAQGDLLVFPQLPPDDVEWEPVPAAGTPLLRGEATDNTHWLHRGFASPDVTWSPVGVGLVLAHVRVRRNRARC